MEGGKVGGSLETKYKCPDYGVNITEKWTTDNSLNTTLDYEKLMPGMKLTLDGNFQPNSGEKAGKSTLTKHNPALNYNAGDMILHATSSDFKSFGGGIYLKNSSQLETGVTCSSAIGGASNFAIGCKYA